MKIYTVRTIPINSMSFEKMLNEFSEKGWEVKIINNSFVVFEREKTAEDAQKEVPEGFEKL